MAAHRSSNRLIGVNMKSFEEQILDMVGKHDKITGQGDHERGRTVVSSSIGDHLKLLG